MRKLMITLALAGLAMSAAAQEQSEEPTQKYSVATNSFWSNWFLQGGVEWSAWYSNQEHQQSLDLDKSPFKGFRGGLSGSLAIGKWFTPGLGLRTKLQGIWGKDVVDNTSKGNFNRYWILNEHILFNLSNMLYGYNPNRVWNFIPFAGGGVGRTMTRDLYAMDLSAGILNEFRVSKHVAVNLELGWNRCEGDIDGTDASDGNRGWDSHDNNLYAELGLTLNLGKATWDKVPDVDAIKALNQRQLDDLNNQLRNANDENARLKDMLAKQPEVKETIVPQSVKEFITTPISVFFDLNKTEIASQKDLVNVRALAKYAKENGSNILVEGYADSATGTPAINQSLSLRRANQVADELVKLGVDRDKIKTAAHGGVNDLSPISFNRRATVQITE
mgnify:CR=1 FL=1|jgi:OOP family OmpA-OmpF porin